MSAALRQMASSSRPSIDGACWARTGVSAGRAGRAPSRGAGPTGPPCTPSRLIGFVTPGAGAGRAPSSWAAAESDASEASIVNTVATATQGVPARTRHLLQPPEVNREWSSMVPQSNDYQRFTLSRRCAEHGTSRHCAAAETTEQHPTIKKMNDGDGVRQVGSVTVSDRTARVRTRAIKAIGLDLSLNQSARSASHVAGQSLTRS
jgi:hypothetical protein